MNIDQKIDNFFTPVSIFLTELVFYELKVFDLSFPLIVVWLIVAALFFTFYFNFINIFGLKHSLHLLKSKSMQTDSNGELSHFQALSTAVSGTVGIGNIGGVAIAISIGGPGVTFWLIIAGLLSMTTKFVECSLGVIFRTTNTDGSVSGGPMYYLEKGLEGRGYLRLGRFLGMFYAFAIIFGCLGIGNMFQANQAYEQFLFLTGNENSFFSNKAWLFGLMIALSVAVVIVGGIKSIGNVASKLVPFMAIIYVIGCCLIIIFNIEKLPSTLHSIISGAFSPDSLAGGMIAVMIIGFQRAAFSNESGLGSAAIAHSAVKTNDPITEGYVALLEPLIDTVIICTMTSLVILMTIYDPLLANQTIQGVQLTSSAFESSIVGSSIPLSFIAILFAYTTILAWSYYGLKGWTYLFGHSNLTEYIFKFGFCIFIILGCMINLESVLAISDAIIFIVAIPNIIGLYFLAPLVKKELRSYKSRQINLQ